ncbi:uroporphyrinogen-III C-methyltransferase [Agromyces sp. M3QZ16-3]|uniref:uroporphyrinogen-III C-methyltransferase n=1 Tax=Agromyces sp. M3QZ16-3 TaxID=3447585 RepID=UPI003F68E46B
MTGRVTLVGGGPGREEFLTVAAVRALGTADVVLYDRLAPHARLAELAPDAELVDVGKRPGHHALPQEEIEALLVAHAVAGRHAVRLKGGDPYVFGRGGEEVLACHRAGVPVEVVPGVTSAVSVPGAAGIPLTHRGISRLFTVVSGHAPLSDDELRHLAGLGGTIVVLMGVGTLPQLAAGLARHGMTGSMPVAIIERGFGCDQRTTVAELSGIVSAAGLARVASPAVIVVGEVVRLAHDGDRTAAELMERAAGFAAVAP